MQRWVFGSAGNDVYAIDDSTLWHWNGMSWTSKTAPVRLSLGWANHATDIWLAGLNSGVHYDGSVFVVVDASAFGGAPVGVATDMFTFNGTNMLRWSGGVGGTVTTTSEFFSPRGGGWRAPSGRVYAAGRGLLVHE